MATRQGAALERRKLMADPILVTTIVVLIAFLTIFILYPLAILLVDSVYGSDTGLTMSIFQRIFKMKTFRTAITNTLKVGFTVGIFSTVIGLLFAYVEEYVKVRTKIMGGLFQVVSMLPVVSPPFVLSLSVIMLFGKAGIIYYNFARGIDDRPVEPVRIRKSIGCEHTLEKDISLQSAVIIELYHVACELTARLKAKGFKGYTLTLKVKFNDFTQITRSQSTAYPLHELKEILPIAKRLMKEVDYATHPVRLIGLSVSNPKEEHDWPPEKAPGWVQLEFDFKENGPA